MDKKFESGSETGQGTQQLMHYVSRPGITEEEVTNIYNVWAAKYNQDLSLIVWNAPRYGADEVIKHFEKQKDACILDAPAGTGLLGIQLKQQGFHNIDALDASEEMLKESKKTGAYKDFHCAFMGPQRLPIADDTYHAVVTVGSFVPGHVKEDCFEELIRITKPGGFIILVMCERYFHEAPEYAGNIEPRMQEIAEAKIWTRTTRRVVSNYHQDYNGVVFVFRIEEGKNMALKELK